MHGNQDYVKLFGLFLTVVRTEFARAKQRTTPISVSIEIKNIVRGYIAVFILRFGIQTMPKLKVIASCPTRNVRKGQFTNEF